MNPHDDSASMYFDAGEGPFPGVTPGPCTIQQIVSDGRPRYLQMIHHQNRAVLATSMVRTDGNGKEFIYVEDFAHLIE
jgi:hypothetical protein